MSKIIMSKQCQKNVKKHSVKRMSKYCWKKCQESVENGTSSCNTAKQSVVFWHFFNNLVFDLFFLIVFQHFFWHFFDTISTFFLIFCFSTLIKAIFFCHLYQHLSSTLFLIINVKNIAKNIRPSFRAGRAVWGMDLSGSSCSGSFHLASCQIMGSRSWKSSVLMYLHVLRIFVTRTNIHTYITNTFPL
jgi:hypothetical protein